jgi:hypothetical protein
MPSCSPVKTEAYLEQSARWPSAGRHILAHFDDETIVVYQAYRPAIARYAIEHGAFGGPDFSFARMSWVKPNFLWMMYRSGWGAKRDQEVILGLRLRRGFFERLLALAVPSSPGVGPHATHAAWQAAVAGSDVRLQWDPDHDPSGQRVERRAIQLGLRGELLREYAAAQILEVIDMTPLVTEQRPHSKREAWPRLRTPEEHVYRPREAETARNVGLDAE